MMTRLALFLLTVFSIQAIAYEDEETEPKKGSYNAAEYAPSEIKVKEAVIRSYLAYHWKIKEHNRFQVSAIYKERCEVAATINGASIEFLEVKNDRCHTFRENWIKSLGNAYIQYIETDYHLRKAENLIREASS